MAVGFSSPGSKGAFSSAAAAKDLFFSMFSGEVDRLWPQAFVLDGKLSVKTISENKEVKDRMTGMVNAAEFARGSILTSSTDEGNAANAAKFTEYITRLDEPLETHDRVYNFDYLMSPSGDQDRQAMIAEMIQAIAFRSDLRGISAILQTAALPQPDVMPSTHPYQTKTIAGTNSGMSGGSNGYNTNVLLTTTAGGSAIEDELFKHRDYLNYLGVPQEDVYTLVSPTYAMKLWKEQGQRVSIGYNTATSSTSLHPATQSIASPPRGPQTLYHMGTGITVVPCRHLPTFGTVLDNAFPGVAATGSKYLPGSTNSLTIRGINSLSDVGAFDLGLGAGTGNPVDWETNAISTKELFNNVRMITFHKRAVRQAILEGLKSGAEKRLDMLNGELIVAWLTAGYGAKDPTAACYSIEALP